MSTLNIVMYNTFSFYLTAGWLVAFFMKLFIGCLESFFSSIVVVDFLVVLWTSSSFVEKGEVVCRSSTVVIDELLS